jgi:hypothetical protein
LRSTSATAVASGCSGGVSRSIGIVGTELRRGSTVR